MKYFILLAVYAVAATDAVISKNERRTIIKNPPSGNPVNFYLFTRTNTRVLQKITATTRSISASNFNARNPTKITIHGWTSSKDDYVNTGSRQAWISRGNYNMITVDWARARSQDYKSAAMAVPGVGRKVAGLINFLVKNYGLKLRDLEIIGHSLGAHVAGFAGKNIASGKAHSIVGLDPAFLLFDYNMPDSRLSSTDAHNVDSIQTSGGRLGYLLPIGKRTFYPNGGKYQPGCDFDLTGTCAHSRATMYYVEAIKNNGFLTIECSSFLFAITQSCGINYSPVRLGAINNANTAAGVYYVPVGSNAPFGVLG